MTTEDRNAGRAMPLKPPAPGSHTPVSDLLVAWRHGDEAALEQLLPIVHAELRRLARRHMARENPGHTLQPTALVNEVYLRLVDLRRMHWQNRAQFFAIAARLMRRILVDFARARHYQKRGGGVRRVSFDGALLPAADKGTDIVALDDAMRALSEKDSRKGQIIELRFFGGLTVEETAKVLRVSTDTVTRDWKLAKAWLLRELKASNKSS
ncbi:MAG TPA: sigma-70 family RNA polymerase sigma factor [Vicinamibacterales bacterium]|nr:sigma-70 family RNA polymerase sigma factor [Vicinamibacterales bacterium]